MMNGLALRINRGGGGKSKNSIGYSPIAIPISLFENSVDNIAEIQAFISSPSSDDQLGILKKLIDTNKDSFADDVMNFLVAAFFHAEAKHPIKCFISRHIIKNKHLQEPFSEALALQISRMSNKSTNYKQYVDIVNKLLTCIENFQAGVVALRSIQLVLAEYLIGCLECCVATLREQKTLSPTEKNEIFTLAHISLRLLLHLVQKGTPEDLGVLTFYFDGIRMVMQDLMFDDDVPMDTKSVSGILYLTMHVAEYGADRWIEVLNSTTTDTYLCNLLSIEAGRLSLFSAIATALAADLLFTRAADGGPAIITLTNKILEIGERSSSESAFILGVARTLLQISKLLDKLTDSATGLTLVDALLLFSWGHLEHYMDSVRHLTGQILGCVVKYCAKMDRAGDNAALVSLTVALQSLGSMRKGFYVCVSWLAAELGAQDVLAIVHVPDVIHALHDQRLRNTASAALDAMLVKLCAECSLEQLRATLVEPCVLSAAHADSAQLAVLEQLLARACARRADLLTVLLPYIKETGEPGTQPRDLKCVLMLLRVCRKSCATDTLSHTNESEWKGVISYELLKQAAVDAVDETRILSLSLLVESPRSTEQFCAGELRVVLHFLRYNVNAQAPNFRQLTMSHMKKFIKRFEQSYAVIKRERQPNGASDKVAYYLRFAEDLRRQCFDCLIPGTNYSRRFVALQILAWCEQIKLEGYERSWEPEYVEKLLLHLEDSYENNKAFALDVLASCPDQLLRSKKYTISLDLENIFLQASSLKPTECVSAAFKLDLLRTKLPDYILQDEPCAGRASPVLFALCSRLHRLARAQLLVCARSVLAGAARAPVFGALHCLARAVQQLDAREISSDEQWTALIADIIDTCMEVNDAVACVVNNSSPEGHLPMDMTVQVTDHGNTGNVTLDDGRQVTAQMVLLCAWRSVKEVSLLLGGICARMTVRGEGDDAADGHGAAGGGVGTAAGTIGAAQLSRAGTFSAAQLSRADTAAGTIGAAQLSRAGTFSAAQLSRADTAAGTIGAAQLSRAGTFSAAQLSRADTAGTLSAAQLSRAGEHFTSLLAETKHRGAFEQAYVGFTMLLDRLWRCRSPALHELPRRWLAQLLQAIALGRGALCATRRSAGVPFIIQALVTTELQVQGNPLCFHGCMASLLQLAADGDAEARGHALHVLRALFRHAALGERVAPHVARGLVLALHAFDAHSWAERNSSTLLLSALVQRVFGVQRSTMTGRIFFLRYPEVYDFMLEKLQEVSMETDSEVLRPSLYPVLLLLARLYPSSLEGTVSNLKLVAFIPHVLACAKSSVMKTRQLAAKAIVPLISPEQYISHIQSMFELLHDPTIKSNYCHGILLQLVRLLQARGAEGGRALAQLWPAWATRATGLLGQPGRPTCYLVADEFVKVLNLLIMGSSTVPQQTVTAICSSLHTLIFEPKPTAISPGRDICLSNAMYLHLILATQYNHTAVNDLVYEGLQHSSYEVVLSVLNYLLILHNNLVADNSKFHEHLKLIADTSTLNKLKNEKYIQLLCKVFKSNYLECQEKSLKILVLEGNTQRNIIETKMGVNVTDDMIIEKLFDYIKNEHEKVTHIYLQSLLNFVTDQLQDSRICIRVLLDVIRVVFECSSSENSEDTRRVVVGFIEKNFSQLLRLNTSVVSELSKAERFELQATTWATIITLLEDDEDAIRQRVSDVLSPTRVTPSRSGEIVLDLMRGRRTGEVAVREVGTGEVGVREMGAGELGVREVGAGELAKGEVGAGELGDAEWEVALFALIALLDFQSVVVVADDVSDECRVFDQNERYNIYLEETVWTIACANILINDYKINDVTLPSIIDKPAYKQTFDKLCKDNVEVFKKMAAGHKLPRNDALNPKIELFVNKLHLVS